MVKVYLPPEYQTGYFDFFLFYSNYLLPALPPHDDVCQGVPAIMMRMRELGPGFTPCKFWDSLKSLAFAIVTTAIAMYLVRFVWARLSRRFRDVEPKHKQMYTVANMFKAGLLAGLCFSSSWRTFIYRGFYLDDWEGHGDLMHFYLSRTVVQYVVTDIVALIVVRKLPMTTKIHHYLAALLCLAIMAYDAAKGDVVRMVGLYGSFSSIAFLVNAFLGLRVMYKEWYMVWVARLALVGYVASCAFNWIWHAAWFANHILEQTVSVGAVVYMAALIFIGRDDVILMQWLFYFKGDKAESAEADGNTTANGKKTE